MKKALLAVFVISSLFTLTVNLAAQAQPQSETKISVQGKAKTEKAPDSAYIVFFVKADGMLTVDALKQLDEKTTLVTDAVTKAGSDKIRSIQKELIKLGDKENFNSMSDKCAPQAINQITLTVEPSIDFAAAIIDTVMRNGGSMKMMNNFYSGDNIANSSVVFAIEKSEDIEKDLAKKALEDARKNAEELAALIGKKIGNPITVNSNYVQNWNNNQQRKFKAKYLSPNYEKINVEVSISVTFQLLDK